MVFTYSISQFVPATFHMLNNYMWLEPTLLRRTALEKLARALEKMLGLEI